MSRHIKIVSRHRLLLFPFFASFLLGFSLFQLTHAKQKVGEYSIIGHTNRSKIVKNMPKNGLKIDEFYTHQIPPNLKFCLSPSKENKFFLSSNNSVFFKDIFLFIAQLGKKHKSVVELEIFSIKSTKPTNNS